MHQLLENLSKKPHISLSSLHFDSKKKTEKNFSRSEMQNSYSYEHADLKILSPFYERLKCNKGLSCKCPYHRCQRLKKIPLINNKRFQTYQKEQLTKQTKNMMTQDRKKVKTHQTENCQKTQKKKFKSQLTRKLQKNYNIDVPNYDEAQYKVDCRNLEFEQYLKKYDLCILKDSKQQNIFRRKSIQIKDQFKARQIKKIVKKLEKKKYLQNGGREHKSYTRSISQIIKMSEDERLYFYRKLKQKIDDEAKNQPEADLKKISQKITDLLNLEQLRKKMQSNAIHIETLQAIQQVIQLFVKRCTDKDLRISGSYKKKNDSIQYKYTRTSETNKQIQSEVGREQNSDLSQKNSLKIDGKIQDKTQRSVEKKFTKKYNVINKANLNAHHQNIDFSDDEIDNKTDSSGLLQNKENCNPHKYHRRGMRNLDKNILQKMTTKKNEDKNIKKLKDHIQRKRSIIKKMEEKLKDDELGYYIITPEDSLLTRKKKLRYLREKLNKRQKWKHFEEVMQYVELFKSPSDKIFSKKTKTEGNEEDRPIGSFLTVKDMRDSLKFIDLQESSIPDHQKIDEGWIKIQQYTTFDDVKIKNKKTKQNKTKNSQNIQQERSLISHSGDLVQINLQNVFEVEDQTGKRIQSYSQNVRGVASLSSLQQRASFRKKISQYRQKMLKKQD